MSLTKEKYDVEANIDFDLMRKQQMEDEYIERLEALKKADIEKVNSEYGADYFDILIDEDLIGEVMLYKDTDDEGVEYYTSAEIVDNRSDYTDKELIDFVWENYYRC